MLGPRPWVYGRMLIEQLQGNGTPIPVGGEARSTLGKFESTDLNLGATSIAKIFGLGKVSGYKGHGFYKWYLP